MKSTFTLVSFLFFLNFSFSQVLGIYEFTGIGACPNQSPNVSSPPSNAVFSPMTSSSVDCVATSGVYNNSNWDPSPNFNPDKYNEFILIANIGYKLNLDSLYFAHRVSSLNCNWHIRSDIDNFSADLASGIDTSILDTTRISLPSSFSNISSVTFRFYANQVADAQRTWRLDDVALIGQVLNSGAGIEEFRNNFFTLSPNPGENKLLISNFTNTSNLRVKVFSTSGKLVSEKEFSLNNEIELNTSLLESGLYFIEITSENHSTKLSWVKI